MDVATAGVMVLARHEGGKKMDPPTHRQFFILDGVGLLNSRCSLAEQGLIVEVA